MGKLTDEQLAVERWLMRGWQISNEIETLREMREEVYDRATSTTSAPSTISVSHSNNPHRFDKYAQLTDEIDEAEDELTETKLEITQAIRTVKNGTLRRLLYQRYYLCRKWEQIAARMHYDERHLRRLHLKALEELVPYVLPRCGYALECPAETEV